MEGKMAAQTRDSDAIGESFSGSKRAKFVSLAESRTVNAIKAIRVIGKLGNRSAYEYGEADVNKITKALIKEVEALKVRMLTKGGKSTIEFVL
jgi:hypothetical protein